MGVGAGRTWTSKVSAKKFVFLVSSGKNEIPPFLAPPRKILEKSPSGSSQKKIIPTSMIATVRYALLMSSFFLF